MKPQRKPLSKKVRFPVQILLGLLVLSAIFYAIWITGPTDSTVVPVPPTRTPVPTTFTIEPVAAGEDEFTPNDQTNGVIVGAFSVMVILLAGTLVAIYPSLKKK